MSRPDSALEYPAVVYQAQGMVCVQADSTLVRALVLMQNTADAAEVTLEQFAAKVIVHEVTFDSPNRDLSIWRRRSSYGRSGSYRFR